ncbi:MAG: D-alanyl-D-alanine carboxypeptidase [Lachnospiraceae bacterium]|nr:D-alanyl-D-alanine carboxypeptidase [Lachnospiraceae bacterium]
MAVFILAAVAVVLAFSQSQGEEKSFLKPYEPEDQAANISRSFQIDTELFASDLCVVTDQAASAEPLDAGAALIFNITDHEVVYGQGVFDRLYPASTTKVMTYLVMIERADLSQKITITDAMLDLDPASSTAGLKAGDVISLEDLLYGMLMVSGNDAAQAIALTVGGTEQGFADLMNEKARELGATGTHFVNAHGLTDEQHYTTAYDLYLILNEALKDERFVEIISAQEHTAYYTGAGGSEKEKTWSVGQLYARGEVTAPEGITVVGGKTGTTSAAKYCMVLYSRDALGKEYISVVLKSPARDVLYYNLNALFSKITN